MFQFSISPTVRSTIAALLLIGFVAAALAVRGASSPDRPALGRADDYATRHVPAVTLSLGDDFATRHVAPPAGLDERDDYATRRAAAALNLSETDDYGTRHGGR